MNKINPRFTLEAIEDRACLNSKGRSDRGLPYYDSDIYQLLDYCKQMQYSLNLVNDLPHIPTDMPTIDAMKSVANTVAKFKA